MKGERVLVTGTGGFIGIPYSYCAPASYMRTNIEGSLNVFQAALAGKIAEAFHLSIGLPVVMIRPINAFGPMQSARAVIPTIVAQSLAGETVGRGIS